MGRLWGLSSLHALKENMSFLSSLFVEQTLLNKQNGRMGRHEFCYYRYMYYKGNIGFVFFVC